MLTDAAEKAEREREEEVRRHAVMHAAKQAESEQSVMELEELQVQAGTLIVAAIACMACRTLFQCTCFRLCHAILGVYPREQWWFPA